MPAGVVIVQLGLGISALGGLAALLQITFPGLPTRERAAALVAAGLLIAAAGALLPAPDRRAAVRRRIDDFLPVYQFYERHTTTVEAPADRVRAAVLSVKLGEIRLASTLLAIRSLGRRRASVEVAQRPLLDLATDGGFVRLAQDERELVLGNVGHFWRLRGGERSGVRTPAGFAAFGDGGWAKAATDFVLVAEAPNRTRVTTETRVATTDAAARRRFAAYWRLIYPGSALLRRTWLRAIKRRAEGGAAAAQG